MKTNRGRSRACLGVLAAMLFGRPSVRPRRCRHRRKREGRRRRLSGSVDPPITVRMMAIVQVSVFEAVNAITGRYPAYGARLAPAPGASVDAAVAAATRTALLQADARPAGRHRRRLPVAARRRARRPGQDGGASPVGEQAADAVVAACADDGGARPTAIGRTRRAASTCPPSPGRRRTGASAGRGRCRGDQFRPGRRPPHQRPLGARLQRDQGARRTEQHGSARAEQTPSRSSGRRPRRRSTGRSPARSPPRPAATSRQRRLLAVASMAMDDALIAVFDAKYA